MIAEDTKGPMKEEVLPMIEKIAKKRNYRVSTTLKKNSPLCREERLPRSSLAEIVSGASDEQQFHVPISHTKGTRILRKTPDMPKIPIHCGIRRMFA